MTTTINSPFRASPRISREGFVMVLERSGSYESDPLWEPYPRKARPDVARSLWDQIVEAGHDPAVWLGIAGKEHTFGTNLNSVLGRGYTHSWTNARSVRHPGIQAEIITDSERRSQYVKYQTVRDSVTDGVYRVDDPTFAYQRAGAEAIAEVIAIWAPASDSNDPDGYARTIAKWINAWAAEFPPEEDKPMDTINSVPFRVDYIPAGNSNRPGHHMTPEYITVHETANTSRGANAEMHRRFVNNSGGAANVSWHYTVDDSEIIQHLPTNESAYHAGDGGNGTGNRKSIGIETCVNADGDWGKTLDNLARLVAWLQVEHGIPETKTVQHNHWSGKNCPTNMRANRGQGWRDMLTLASTYRKPEPEPDKLIINGYKVIGGFRERYEALGKLALPTLGVPRSDEFQATVDGVERTAQLWERAGALGWYPAGDKHGVPPSDPMHVRVLTFEEAQDVWRQAKAQGVI